MSVSSLQVRMDQNMLMIKSFEFKNSAGVSMGEARLTNSGTWEVRDREGATHTATDAEAALQILKAL